MMVNLRASVNTAIEVDAPWRFWRRLYELDTRTSTLSCMRTINSIFLQSCDIGRGEGSDNFNYQSSFPNIIISSAFVARGATEFAEACKFLSERAERESAINWPYNT